MSAKELKQAVHKQAGIREAAAKRDSAFKPLAYVGSHGAHSNGWLMSTDGVYDGETGLGLLAVLPPWPSS